MAENVDTLFEALTNALPKSYSPYSNFKVAAAIVDERGNLSSGVNIENAAYPEGWCAETSAISHMIMSGGQKIKTIGVMGVGELLCTPCGGCRQRIREFGDTNTQILIFGLEGLRQTYTIEDLLPASFGPDNLETR